MWLGEPRARDVKSEWIETLACATVPRVKGGNSMRWILLFSVMCSGVAVAVPSALTHQGRLMGPDGIPMQGAVEVEVSLFDEQGSSTSFWTSTYDAVPVDDGYFAVRLVTDDAGEPIDNADLADGEVWLQTSVNGVAMGERERLSSVPFAMMSGGVQLPSTTPGTCTSPGLLGYDEGTGNVLLCHGGAFQVLGSVEGGGAAEVVGVRNAGQPGEWALLRMTSTTQINDIADWRAVCGTAGLGVPASSEPNDNCAANLGTPRYVVTSRCNMYNDGEDTWASDLGVFQGSFPGGRLMFLRYSSASADSPALKWNEMTCTSASAGATNNSTCPYTNGGTGAITLLTGEWLTCARPL